MVCHLERVMWPLLWQDGLGRQYFSNTFHGLERNSGISWGLGRDCWNGCARLFFTSLLWSLKETLLVRCRCSLGVSTVSSCGRAIIWNHWQPVGPLLCTHLYDLGWVVVTILAWYSTIGLEQLKKFKGTSSAIVAFIHGPLVHCSVVSELAGTSWLIWWFCCVEAVQAGSKTATS